MPQYLNFGAEVVNLGSAEVAYAIEDRGDVGGRSLFQKDLRQEIHDDELWNHTDMTLTGIPLQTGVGKRQGVHFADVICGGYLGDIHI